MGLHCNIESMSSGGSMMESLLAELGLCLGWYGHPRSSIRLPSVRDRVATAAETDGYGVPCPQNSVNNTIKRLKKLIGSLGHHQNLTHCWHHGTRHTCKVS